MARKDYTNTFVNGTVAEAPEVNTNFADAVVIASPIGAIMPWLKTFSTVSSGTADTNTLDSLEDTGATFQADGVTEGMIIYNSTDDTFGIVDSVDSETLISIRADVGSGSSTTDVFPLGTENYVIYATPESPVGWAECNGQTISDAASPYNGVAIPDLHSAVEEDYGRFLRGFNRSGITHGSQNKTHTHTVEFQRSAGTSVSNIGASANSGLTSNKTTSGSTSSGVEVRTVAYTTVFIMRIK